MIEKAELRRQELQHAIDAVEGAKRDLPELLKQLTESDGQDAATIQATVELVAGFLQQPLVQKSYLAAPEENRGRQPVTDSLLNSIWVNARGLVESLREQEVKYLDQTASRLRLMLTEALERNDREEFQYLSAPEQKELNSALAQIGSALDALNGQTSISQDQKRAREAALNAEASAAKASAAAGVTGEVGMFFHYDDLAGKEEKAAEKFRKWTIQAAIVGGAVAAIFLIGPALGLQALHIAAGDYVHLIQRIVVTAAIFGLAAYFARQAHHHRSMANWAASLAVQLQTFEAFLDPIADDQEKHELRKSFAARAFGDHPAMKGEPSVSASAATMDAAVALAAKIAGSGK